MRTNIVIDDDLMDAAMKAGEFKTKRDAVEEGLRLLARRASYQNLRVLRGKLQWSLDGDWTATAGSEATVAGERRAAYRVPARGKAKK